MKNIYLVLILVLFFLSSCKNDEDITQYTDIAFITDIKSRNTQENSTFEKGNAIGIFAEVNGKLLYSNSKYIYNGSLFEAASALDKIRVAIGQDVKFYAYYPYDAINTDIEHIVYMVSSQETKENWLNADFLTANTSVTVEKFEVPLHFNHMMATVTMNVNQSETEATSATLKNVKTSISANLKDGSFNTLESTSNLNFFKKGESEGIGNFIITIPPQKLTIDNNKVNLGGATNIDVKAVEDLNAEAGKISHYILDYRKNIRIIDYPAGGTTSGGGLHVIGTICSVMAETNTGYEFIGWFDEANNMLSDSKIYKFNVKEDINLYPKYRNYEDWELSISCDCPELIPYTGGTYNLSAKATRGKFINGVPEGTMDEVDITGNLLSDNTYFVVVPANKSLTVSENTTTSNRTAKVSVSYANKLKEIQLTQGVAEKKYGEWRVTVSATGSVPAIAGSTPITSSAERDVTISGILVETEIATPSLSVSGTGFSISGTNLIYEENTSETSRIGTITATYDGKTATCSVTQEGAKISKEYIFTTATASINFEAKPSTGKTIEITSTKTVSVNGKPTTSIIEYTCTDQPTWITVNSNVVSVSENQEEAPRTGKIVFTQSESNNKLEITVTQEAANKEYGEKTLKDINVSASPANVGAKNSQSIKFTISANYEQEEFLNGVLVNTIQTTEYPTSGYTLKSDSEWLIISEMNGSTTENKSETSRIGTITATYDGKTATCSVTQEGAKIEYTNYIFSVTPTALSFDVEGETKSFTVTSTKEKWVNETFDSIVKIDYSVSASGEGLSCIGTSATFTENNTDKRRTGIITLTQGETGKIVYIECDQDKWYNVEN